MISPSLDSLPMLEIIAPLPIIHSTIDMLVNTSSVRLIIGPETLIHISVDMYEFAFTVRFIISPFTDVPGSIVPDLGSVTITESALPLASIGSPRSELVSITLFPLLFWIVTFFSHGFLGFIHREVLARALLLRTKHTN